MSSKVFRRRSDGGHASIFKARVTAGMISIEVKHGLFPMGPGLTTTLDKEDAKAFALWLLEKTK